MSEIAPTPDSTGKSGSMASISFSALRLASELGHRQTGEEHLFVSWLEADLPQDQRQFLEALGLTGASARAALVATTAGENRRDPESGTMSGPTYHRARGRARGLALAADRTVPSTDDVLRACLLDEGPAGRLLATIGVSRSDVMLGLGHVVEDVPSDTLSGPATDEAMVLSGAFVGSWHFVLALLADHPDAVAGDALRACGITHGDYGRGLAAWLSRSQPPVRRLTPGSLPALSSAGHEILGRAEGFAVADASPVVRSRDGVLAWLWDDFGHAVSETRHGDEPGHPCADQAGNALARPTVAGRAPVGAP